MSDEREIVIPVRLKPTTDDIEKIIQQFQNGKNSVIKCNINVDGSRITSDINAAVDKALKEKKEVSLNLDTSKLTKQINALTKMANASTTAIQDNFSQTLSKITTGGSVKLRNAYADGKSKKTGWKDSDVES